MRRRVIFPFLCAAALTLAAAPGVARVGVVVGIAPPATTAPNDRDGWLPALGTRGFHRPLSDPRADLRLRFHGSERDGRNVPVPDVS
jgi:hypothetical protein